MTLRVTKGPSLGYSFEIPKSPKTATSSPVSFTRRIRMFSGFMSLCSSRPSSNPPQPPWQNIRPVTASTST